MSFDQNVFINCPFDDDYRPLLRPLLFTVLYLGLKPRIAETTSSGNIRIQEIKRLIGSSKYSIHDISRNEALNPGDLPRFNMPLELGIDIGCQEFGDEHLSRKKCLVLDKEKYRYQRFVSDIGGQDIKEHGNDPQKLIAKIREWFAAVLKQHLPGPSLIWEFYNEFIADMTSQLKGEGFKDKEIDELPFSNFIILAQEWILRLKKEKPPRKEGASHKSLKQAGKDTKKNVEKE
jgi:hypothetical protein